jgi:hypothetical protein
MVPAETHEEQSMTPSTNPAEVEIVDPDERFNYCVGRPWPQNLGNSDGKCIRTYAYGTEVHCGTLADANAFLRYVK